MTAERVYRRQLPRNIPAAELVTRVKRKSVDLADRDSRWMLQELEGIFAIRIPDRLAQKLGFSKLNWYKISPSAFDYGTTQVYLGFEKRVSRKSIDWKKANAIVLPQPSKETSSVRLFGNICDSSGVNRIVALQYSLPGFHLSSAAFSLPDINQSLDVLFSKDDGRFTQIPSADPRLVFATSAMIGKTERSFITMAGIVVQTHRHMVSMDDIEIRKGLDIQLGQGEDQALISARNRFRDCVFTFRHQPLEGRVNLGNWKISVPKKLS